MGFRAPKVSSPPAQEAPVAKADPVPVPQPEPVHVTVPMEGGIAEAIDALRSQLASQPARLRPTGIDAVVTDRDAKGMMKTVSMTFRWG